MDPPAVPRELLDGWRRVDETMERPFAAGPITVRACTVRYEQPAAQPSPFFFASRLRIRPKTPPNGPLTRLVERQAKNGFRDRLADRDITAVTHREDRPFQIDDPVASRATLSTFHGTTAEATSPAEAAGTPIESLLAVWHTDDYLLAGGGYPLGPAATTSRRSLRRLIRGVSDPRT